MIHSKKTEKKRVLLAANLDYFSFSEPIAIGDTFEFKFVITQNFSTPLNYNVVSGENNSFRATYIKTNGTLVLIGCTLTSYTINGVPSLVTEDIRNHIGETIILKITSTVVNVLKRMGSRHNNTDYIDADYFNLNINGKDVPLNEGNGNTFKSTDESIIGTFETSHVDGEDYFNLKMCVGIGLL